MAEDEVATKAPENDAHEPSMVSPEDTPAQKGASMGVNTCFLCFNSSGSLMYMDRSIV